MTARIMPAAAIPVVVPLNDDDSNDLSIPAVTEQKQLNWFEEMPSFQAFKRDVTKGEYYRVAPDDWHVVITDVKGSTKAIEEGRYKDVNTIGAASISTVQNLLSPETFPFVFGGDGATLLVSPKDIDRVLEALLKLQVMAEENFSLGLRVGHVTVGEVHSAGGGSLNNNNKTIQVAKHELTAGRCTAVFRGGGLTVAEAMIKGQETKYCVQPTPAIREATLELSGLSCRWNPVPSKRGKVMSLLVAAQDGGDDISEEEIYTKVLAELDQIYNGHLEEANPLNTDLITYKSVDENMENEERYFMNVSEDDRQKRRGEIQFACSILRDTNTPQEELPEWASNYRDSMRPHADHRKFDDMLRMIIDCSDEQADQIQAMLEAMRLDKKIHYGIFLSETALMTCYLEDLSDGHHIHFVDGGDGGYAMAAKQLKAQLKEKI